MTILDVLMHMDEMDESRVKFRSSTAGLTLTRDFWESKAGRPLIVSVQVRAQ